MQIAIAALYCAGVVQILIKSARPCTIVPQNGQVGKKMERPGRELNNNTATCSLKSADALEKFRQPLASYLISALDDQDKWVRYLAAEMLGNIQDPGSAGHLTRLLADQDEDVRSVATKALDSVRHTKKVFASMQASSCETCLIRMIAAEALAKLGTQLHEHVCPVREEEMPGAGKITGDPGARSTAGHRPE
jgi:HEAT repeat protein